jgi:predicted acetyltransferase
MSPAPTKDRPTYGVNVEVVEAAPEDKPVVRQLLELYQHDFSEFEDADVDRHGFYGYPYLDHYWTEHERHPFLFRADGNWAGFALVRSGDPHDLAEFFVMRKYRRRGVGIAAARDVFARFPGRWQVRQMASNPASTAFWTEAIPVAFEQDVADHGPVQRFTIPGP